MKRAATTSATIAVAMLACAASAGTLPTTAWVTETFDDGNVSGWYWNYFDPTEMLVTPSDGNPGAYLRTPETLVAPLPDLSTTPGVPSAFTGSYAEQLVERLGVDLLVVQDPYGRAPVQQLSLRLVASDGWGIELFTADAPLPETGAGWKSFEFDVPSQGGMPADAVVFGDAPPEPWTTLMQDVDHVEFAFGERAWFEICWEFGLDNARIRKVSNEPCTGDFDGSGTVGFPDLTALLAAWGNCPPADVTLFAVTSTGDLLEIDTTSGAGTLIDTVGYDSVQAMAFDSQHRIFMTVFDASTPGESLAVVDPVTASGSIVAPLSGLPAGTQTMALAFDSNDQLFGLVGSPTAAVALVRIDPTDGSVVVVGTTGYAQIWGMTFDDTDTLYCVIDDENALGTIDVGTGQVQRIGAPGSLSVTDALALGAAGQLYAAATTLVEINPATGVETVVGSIDVHIQDLGAMHVPVACPLDLTGDGNVGFPDLTTLLANWGPCGG